MVFVRNDKIFAKVWKIDKKEKYADLRISTSEKVEKDGNTEYVNSNWFARAVGKAFNQLKDINEGDRVVITKELKPVKIYDGFSDMTAFHAKQKPDGKNKKY